MPFDPAQRLAELLPQVRRKGGAGGARHSQRIDIVVALSGGVDSIVLLVALAAARRRFASVRACHVNHHLSPAADQWATFCRREARRCRVPLTVLQVRGRPPRGASVEEWARERRYELLARQLRPHDVLVTAHHADDQAETVLLQLLRGAGVAGLAAMPAIAPFGAGWLARPLLHTTRETIEAYAREHQLDWVRDDMNLDERWARSFVRGQVMPMIRSRWPAAAAVIARSATHLAEAKELLDERAQADLARIVDGTDLLVSGLRALPAARRRNVLRAWFASRGVRMPDTTRLAEIAGPLLEARWDAQPRVAWGDAQVVRVGGRLRVEQRAKPKAAARRVPTPVANVAWDWRREPRCVTPLGTLTIEPDAHGPIDLDALPAALVVSGPRPRERIRLAPKRPSQAVRTLLQGVRMPVTGRRLLPRVWGGTKLLALGDRWLDCAIQATPSSRSRGRLTVKSGRNDALT